MFGDRNKIKLYNLADKGRLIKEFDGKTDYDIRTLLINKSENKLITGNADG